MKKALLAAVLASALLCCRHALAATLTAQNDGVRIDAGTFGSFTLTYPVLDVGTDKMLEPVEKTAAGKHAALKYAGGTAVDVTIGDNGEIAYAFSNPPAALKTYRMSMLIDFGFNDGGAWSMGGSAKAPFPKEKPAKPHLYQGNSNTFVLTAGDGRSMSFVIPAYSYQEITDNREWNWKIYNWMFAAPLDAANPRGTVKVADGASAGKPVVIVDRYGQDAALDFPGKVKSDDELKADVARDAAYFGAFNPPQRDTYGGLPGSGASLALKKTGFFHVEKKGARWLLVDPDGNANFHLGICGFQPGDDYTYIKGREELYAWLPPYESEYKPAFSAEAYWSRDVFSFYVANQIRKYGSYDADALAKRMIERVRKVGFNAVGAFSNIGKPHRDARFPWVGFLPLDAGSLGAPVEGLRGIFDPYSPQAAANMDKAFAGDVARDANEPLLIGYFLANEQAFEDIPRVIPGLKGTQPAKQRLVAMLQAKYKTIAAYNTAWGASAASFDALKDMGLAVTTKAASEDMAAFTGDYIEAYYKLIHDTFCKYDRNHLIIGNRWQPITANNEQLCRIAGKYCDVISVNYYTYGIDKAFLQRLHDWSGDRPMMLSEFYWTSVAESGLPGGSEVKSQRERGLAYRNYVEQAASTGFVVGIEWFILIDQARTGRWFERYTGEKANTGLFSVTDRPYKDFLAEAAKTNYAIYDTLLGKRPAFAWDDPRFQPRGTGQKVVTVPRALGAMKLDGKRDGWPGNPPETVPSSRIVIGADGTGFDGSFRLCWDDANLYLMVQVTDPTPMCKAEKGPDLWNGDGVELFIGPEGLDQGGAPLFSDRQVLLGAGTTGDLSYINRAPKQTPCKVVVIPAVDGKGYLLEAAIPFEGLGFTPKEGQILRFDLAFDDGEGDGRKRQLMWSGDARNSGDRTNWGRAKLVK